MDSGQYACSCLFVYMISYQDTIISFHRALNIVAAVRQCLESFIVRRQILENAFVRQHNSAIQRVWQATMTTTDHHGTYNQLAECAKHARQGRHHSWVAEAETDVATT